VIYRAVSGDGNSRPAAAAPDPSNPFIDVHGNPRVLRGVAIYSGSTRLAELAVRVGFDTIWIEMEHGPADFTQVEQLCMAIEAGGGIPTVRVPDGQRNHVLRALEVGARIVVVPMINTADQARSVIEFGKFPPLGARGYNIRSRGVDYGIGDRQTLFERANARTHLFAQIESIQAVENLQAICQVPGLAGIFIGPGDLSASLGITGKLNCDEMVQTVQRCIAVARAAGKHVGILVPPGNLLDVAFQAGCNLLFFGGDVSELGVAWPALLNRIPAAPVVGKS
jgi:2-keto-3-deoxy-L-rhamnonate aldolase RhmA